MKPYFFNLYSGDEAIVCYKKEGGRVEQKYRPNVQTMHCIEYKLVTYIIALNVPVFGCISRDIDAVEY